MTTIAIHGGIYDYPHKGHDRLFIDSEQNFAAVFDGAGGDELSEAAVRSLRTVGSLATTSMTELVVQLDNLPEGIYRKATAAIAVVHPRAEDFAIDYANTGDSSLYAYDAVTDKLQRLAHTETMYVRAGSQTYIDTCEFLGNFREAEEVTPYVGRLVMPRHAPWSVVGLSDGVRDDDGQGISEPRLAELIRTTPPGQLATAILDDYAKYDDASLFVIANQP